MTKAVLVPGIRTIDPSETMGGLKKALEARKIETVYADYGYVLIPFTNAWAEREIKQKASLGDTIIGYSNGGAAAIEVAGKLGAKHLVLISPAARSDTEYPECLRTVTVYYSPGDWAVAFGTLYSRIISAMPWRWGTPHGWGNLGLYGPQSKDKRVHGIKMGDKIAHSWHQYPELIESIATHAASLTYSPAY